MPKKPATNADLKLLLELIEEQRGASKKLAKESPQKVNAMWMAKGDHLVLLISKSDGKPEQRLYAAQILDVKDST